MQVIQTNRNIELRNVKNFILEQTLDCGQAFRWNKLDENLWHGVAYGKYLKIGFNDGTYTLYDTSIDEFNEVWRAYFDLDRDYSSILNALSDNEILKKAGEFSAGIRILKQEPWETLCSFIISQNNNIPRIKGIIDRLCSEFGQEIKENCFSFPSAEKISTLSLDDLSVLRSGFRAKYIIDAAKKIANGKISLDSLIDMSIDDARNELMKIYGVGNKVADCTLLFGLSHIEAFPQDVWIKKAMGKLFDGVLPECALPYAGIAQQYLFHYARMTKLEI